MLCWKCDVCGKLGEALTSEANLSLKPKGWRERTGVVLVGKHKVEVRLHACSAECASQYDLAEAAEVGLGWWESAVVTDGAFKPVRPLKVKRRPKGERA